MPEADSAEARIPLKTIAVYALPAATAGFMGAFISFYLLKFSTDVLLIAPAAIGAWFGLSRIWDAVTDPVAGYWSDRTQTRLGRRRPWLVVSALPLSLLFVALWAPPSQLGGAALVWWMGIGIVLFYSAQTVLVVPHASLGAELSLDHHDRTRVFAGRLVLDLAGVMLAAMALYQLERSSDARVTAQWIATGGAALCVTLIWVSAWLVRERPEYQGRGGATPYASFRDVVQNSHARILIAVFLLEVLGFTSMTAMMPYAMQYWLEMQGMGSIFIGSAIGVMVVTIPLWVPLSRRFGKRRVWRATLFLRAAAFGMLFLFGSVDSTLLIMISIGIIGASYGGGGVIGPSVKADVIDCDEHLTGERKEGTYFATWNLAVKGGAGLAVFLAGFVLQTTGFRPNVDQTPEALMGIRLLFAGFPCVFYLAAGILMLRFQLTESEHLAIRRDLDARLAAAAAQGSGTA